VTTSLSDVIFRVLVVEDTLYTLRFLAKLLREALGRVAVDTAQTVDEGTGLIERRRSEGIRYHLGLLDFKLPSSPGMQPEVDTRICHRLRQDGAPIIHYTGWPDDPEIKAHMRELHSEEELSGARVTLVAKTATSEWAERILELTIPYRREVISGMIRERLHAVLGVGVRDGAMGSHAEPLDLDHAASRRCGTHALIQLHEDIIQNWGGLKDSLKSEIKHIFPVADLDGEEKRLSLLPPEDE